MYVVPFVAKVVESCAKSRVFRHPNPWTTGNLNLNLKFEIEVLCKALGLELTSLTPGTLLKDFDKINKILKMPSMGPSAAAVGGGQQKQDGGMGAPSSIVGIPPATQPGPMEP